MLGVDVWGVGFIGECLRLIEPRGVSNIKEEVCVGKGFAESLKVGRDSHSRVCLKK